ncbi:MAG TPA: glycosyltransferase family 2 protein [Bryobacteraceae bacterium]|jgi:glycosyltransferase involved in cell wall biosynthesis|nr:glycosyltransferase family 2 protein [Bryobacteraceae bacterium]
MKSITILTPCFNEEENVEECYLRVRDAMLRVGRYRYEHLFIDNSSTDNTVAVLKQLAAQDKNVKIIVNTRNFGQVRSPMYALTQMQGDAIIGIVADLQDPPEMIPQLIEKWEQGYSMVICVKETSQENPLMFWVRTMFYRIVQKLASVRTFQHFTGFGLYDRRVIDVVLSFKDPYPFFRGMIAEIGLPHCEVVYNQPSRKRGFTKNDFFTLYDIAMLGITNMSKVPLRIVTFTGFACSLLSMLVAGSYLVYKLLFWYTFELGLAPLIIGLFFFGSVQLVSLGVIGEYVGAIHTHVQQRPYAIEKERVNFEFPPGEPLRDDGALGNLAAALSQQHQPAFSMK